MEYILAVEGTGRCLTKVTLEFPTEDQITVNGTTHLMRIRDEETILVLRDENSFILIKRDHPLRLSYEDHQNGMRIRGHLYTISTKSAPL